MSLFLMRNRKCVQVLGEGNSLFARRNIPLEDIEKILCAKSCPGEECFSPNPGCRRKEELLKQYKN